MFTGAVRLFRQSCRYIQHAQRPTFQSLDLHNSVLRATQSLKLLYPTEIQKLSSRCLIKKSGIPTLLLSPPNSGKTLAYLLPLFSYLKHHDIVPPLQPPPNRPRVIVILPTKELAWQTFRVAKQLGQVAKVRVRLGRMDRELGRVDVLVGTAGMIGKMKRERMVGLKQVWRVVVDEADVMVGKGNDGFGEDVKEVIDGVDGVVYASASVDEGFHKWVKRNHAGKVREVRAEGVDRMQHQKGRVETEFVEVKEGEMGKMDMVEKIVRRVKGSVMIFVDGRQRRKNVAEEMEGRCDEQVVVLSSEVEERKADWERWTNGEVRVAICSGGFARGVDVDKVECVVMMDVPKVGREYMHRAGRVRGKGHVFVLVNRGEEPMARMLYERQVTNESMATVDTSRAWTQYTDSGRWGGGKLRYDRERGDRIGVKWIQQ